MIYIKRCLMLKYYLALLDYISWNIFFSNRHGHLTYKEFVKVYKDIDKDIKKSERFTS